MGASPISQTSVLNVQYFVQNVQKGTMPNVCVRPVDLNPVNPSNTEHASSSTAIRRKLDQLTNQIDLSKSQNNSTNNNNNQTERREKRNKMQHWTAPPSCLPRFVFLTVSRLRPTTAARISSPAAKCKFRGAAISN